MPLNEQNKKGHKLKYINFGRWGKLWYGFMYNYWRTNLYSVLYNVYINLNNYTTIKTQYYRLIEKLFNS